jgi:predicted MFS family arabinose efflux permease
LIVAVVMFFIVREPGELKTASGAPPRRPSFGELFAHRNVPLAMLTLMCAMGGVFVLAAMGPNYLTDYLHLSVQDMGFVFSAVGFGGALGQFAMPTVSDFIGRKLATLLSYILAAVFTYLFAHAGAGNLTTLFILLFFASLFNFSALAILAGPVAAESAPLGMVASVAGLVIGAGEVFGGGVAPAIAGRIAASSGIQNVFVFTIGSLILGFVIALFLKETAPRKTGEA